MEKIPNTRSHRLYTSVQAQSRIEPDTSCSTMYSEYNAGDRRFRDHNLLFCPDVEFF